MSNDLAIVLPTVRQHEALIVPRMAELDKWSGGGEARGEALVRYTMAELSVNDDLRSCTPTSIYLALLSCAVTGLVPGKLRGYSFLVPFGNNRKGPDGKDVRVQEATFMMGWRGVKHIGYRSGLHLISAVIHENDKFDYDVGTKRFVTYTPALRGAGPIIGAAAWAELPNGRLEVEFLNMETLNAIKAAATRIRKSPAWDGPFRDQMERKSALKRLGKQVDMGEEFFKADAIEQAQDDDGSPARALDELTDGAASKVLGQQSTEAAAFGHLPRPAQVQVAGEVGTTNTGEPVRAIGSVPPDKLGAATDKARSADKARAARPTSAAGTSGAAATTKSSSPASSGSGTPPSKPPANEAAPTSQTPATSSAGSASPPASAGTPAASSAPSSNTAPPSSTASESTSTSSEPGPDVGDVAGEPASDGDFDTSFFGDDESDDPVDRTPKTRGDWIATFKTWSESHATKADAVRDWPQFREIFDGWLSACANKGDMDEDKPVITGWSGKLFSKGRKADPARSIAAQPADPQIVEMQDLYAKRYKELP